MTAVDVDTSLEVWELTLPEDEATCEAKYGCDRAATWLAVIRPCGCATPLCSPCLRKGRLIFDSASGWQCNAHLGPAVTLDEYPI